MGYSRTSITMIELLLWWAFLIPMMLLCMAYLLIMGWSNPAKIVTVYSADTNRIDETGGPYEVEIE